MTTQAASPPAADLPRPSSTKDSGMPVIPSSVLLAGQAAVLIEHQGQRYRLQTTRQGKLILTK